MTKSLDTIEKVLEAAAKHDVGGRYCDFKKALALIPVLREQLATSEDDGGKR